MEQILSHKFGAESIAHALPGCRKVKPDQWKACCPAHTDKTPSLSITERNGKALFKCWSGCDQGDIIAALQRQGLWPERKTWRSAKVHTLTDKATMRTFVAAHEYNLKRRKPTSKKHQQLYSQYQRILYAPFSAGEVAEMHLFCLVYKADVRSGKTTSLKDDEMFTGFSRLVYEFGLLYAW